MLTGSDDYVDVLQRYEERDAISVFPPDFEVNSPMEHNEANWAADERRLKTSGTLATFYRWGDRQVGMVRGLFRRTRMG